MHPDDMWKASVFFYNIIENGFSFCELDLDNAMEKSNDHYSDYIKEYLHQMVDVLNDLSNGQRKYSNNEYYIFIRE